MAYQPVTLKGGNQWLYPGVDIWGKGGKGHGKEGKGNHKGAKIPALDSPLYNQIEQYYSPGKKDKRFIEIGKWCMSNSHLVGLKPPQDESHSLGNKPNKGNN